MDKENEVETLEEIFYEDIKLNCAIRTGAKCLRLKYVTECEIVSCPTILKLTALIQAEREKVIDEIEKILPASVSKSLGYTNSELCTMIYEANQKLSDLRRNNGK